jgi:hypothetical protein
MAFMPRSRWIRVVLVCLSAFFLLATFFVVRALRFDARAAERDIAAVARSNPNFTVQQRMGLLRHITSALHPKGSDLTFDGLMKRFARFLTATSNSLPPSANFVGNLTVVGVKDGDLLAMPQQTDCSLNMDDWAYTVDPSTLSFSYTLASSTPNVQLALHSAAGLTTSPGHYPAGCGNTSVGATSRKVIFVGVTKNNIRVYAGHFYDSILGGDQIFAVTSQANDNFLSTTKLNDPNNVADLATSDLNSDGNGDLVAIDDSLTTGGNATVNVFLGKADGSFSGPTQIALQGVLANSAVIDDFNGDGIKDVVVSTTTFSMTGGSTGYTLNVLLGKGDGTFQPLQTYTETPPTNIVSPPYFGLISADLRGSGHKDLITSAGVILFGKGDGTFTQSATVAFPSVAATSDSGPNVVAADFNKDGKPDLAVNNGVSTQVFLGKGDGTFTAKAAYSTIGNIGYLIAQDLDGDGNIDLYSGAGNNGSIGGDSFINNLGYALMGNGDGTFRGAPSEQFAYTGTNLGDLTGKGVLSAVAVTSNGNISAFTSYL